MISAQPSWNVPAGKLLGPRARHDDGERRHVAAVLDGLRACHVDHRHRARQRHVRREHRALADQHALGEDAARADEGAVLDDHRPRLHGLEDATDADAACEVHVGADLRARADRRPGVDHRVRPDPRTDVHVARHHHDAAARDTSRSAPSQAARHARRAPRSRASAESCPGTRTARPRSSPSCGSGSSRGSPPLRSSFTLHSPSIFSATRISPRSSAAIVSSVVTAASSRMTAARSHSSSVGTSAKRM